MWLVTFTLDEGVTQAQVTVRAADYSEAYTKVIFDYPVEVIIVDIQDITRMAYKNLIKEKEH